MEDKLELILKELVEIKRTTSGIDTRLGAVELKIDVMDRRLGTLETKVDAIDSRLDTLETKVDTIDSRLGVLESKVDTIDSRLGTVESSQKELNQMMITILGRQEEADAKLDAISMVIHRTQGELTSFKSSQERKERILGILSLRSLEHEADIQLLKQN